MLKLMLICLLCLPSIAKAQQMYSYQRPPPMVQNEVRNAHTEVLYYAPVYALRRILINPRDKVQVYIIYYAPNEQDKRSPEQLVLDILQTRE